MLRWLTAPGRLSARFRRAIAAEEQAGLVFAFRTRTVAVAAVILWLLLVIEPQRQAYYIAVAVGFFLLGLVPHLMRHHRHAVAIRFAFVLLDVILVTAVVILPPPGELDVGWPIQTRVRSAEFLYLNLLIVGAALSYSPLQVAWTGLCTIVIWSAGVLLLYMRADTVHVVEGASSDTLLQTIMNPYHVSIFTLLNQVVLTAIATAALTAAVWRARTMLVRQTRAEIARADLSRYVSSDVADRIMAADTSFGAPSERSVAILFADIVGFTGLSEQMSPDRVVRLLKSFHERCCAVVFRHGGSLDKYMGDGFLATFGAITPMPDAAARAVRCAVELQEAVERWNAKRQARGAATVRLSVGVHCGSVVVGNLGSGSRLEFTVVGDAVNIASRLEAATRRLDCRIAVTEDCMAAAQACDPHLPGFDAIGPLQLDGRAQMVNVCIWPQRQMTAERLEASVAP